MAVWTKLRILGDAVGITIQIEGNLFPESFRDILTHLGGFEPKGGQLRRAFRGN